MKNQKGKVLKKRKKFLFKKSLLRELFKHAKKNQKSKNSILLLALENFFEREEKENLFFKGKARVGARSGFAFSKAVFDEFISAKTIARGKDE